MRHLGASVLPEMWEKRSLMGGSRGEKEKGNFTPLTSKCGRRVGAPQEPLAWWVGRAARDRLVE